MKHQKIIIPSKPILDLFDRHIEGFIDGKDNLATKNKLLKIARDRLLSRLMSGKIDVEQLDIHFPDSMKEEAASA